MYRPTFDNLPDKGYQDNPAVDALLSYYDARLISVADTMGNLWQRLSLTAPLGAFGAKFAPSGVQIKPEDYVVEVSALEQVAGYSITVNTTTVFSIQTDYPLLERGRSHFLRITDNTQQRVVFERSFSAKASHYFTNIRLAPGSYFVATNYYLGLPILTSPTLATPFIDPAFTLDRTVRVLSGTDGVSTTPRPNQITPLSIAKQTPAELQQSDSLDYVAYLLGLTGRYWSTKWDTGAKLNLIRNANQIQQWRGTERGLRLVLDAHDISYRVRGSNPGLGLPFQLGVTNAVLANGILTSSLGLPRAQTFILMPISAQRNQREFIEAQRTVESYTAVTSSVQVCYVAFFLGYSSVGDPVFN